MVRLLGADRPASFQSRRLAHAAGSILILLSFAEITFGCFDRDMAEQKLNLLQFASGRSTQASARPTQVVGRQPIVADACREFLDHVPDQFLGYAVSPGLARAAHLSEDLSCLNARRYHQLAECAVDLIRYRDGTDVAALPRQGDDRPMAFALLQVVHRQFRNLVSPKATRQQNR